MVKFYLKLCVCLLNQDGGSMSVVDSFNETYTFCIGLTGTTTCRYDIYNVQIQSKNK
jgi:hypothetical protein